MARLIIKSPDGESTHELVDDVTTFGRASTNIIQVKDEQASREHCRIERSGEEFRLIDLGSRNGTQVNGARVSQQTLRVGDEIVIGHYRMVFDAPQQVTAEELGGTVEVDTVEDEVSAVEAAKVSPPEKPMYVLEVVEGPDTGKTVEVGDDPVTMGRHASNAFPLSDESASNYHAAVTREAIGYVITDLGSTNGTKVNGERVVKTVLSSGAIIEIAQTKLAFRNLGKPTEEDQVFGTVVLDTEKLERELLEDESRSRRKLVFFVLGAAVVLLALLGSGYGVVRVVRAVAGGGGGIPGNLLRNYSFDGETDDVGAPRGWRWQSNPNLLWEVVTSTDRLPEKREKGALSLTRRSEAPADAMTFSEHLGELPLEFGSGYKLGGFVRGEAATGVYGLRVEWLGPGERTDFDLAALYGPQNDWKGLARVFNPPAWATRARVWCFACGNHGRIFFDDVYFLPVEKAQGGRETLALSGKELSAEFNDRGLIWVRSSGAPVADSVELYLKSAEHGSPEALQGLGRASSPRRMEGAQFFELDVVDFGTLAEFHLMERVSATRDGLGVEYTLTCPVGGIRARELGLRISVRESFAETEPVIHEGEGGRKEEVVFSSPEGERFAIHAASAAVEVRTEARSGYWLVELVLAKKMRLRRVPLTYRIEFNPFSVFERRRIEALWKKVAVARESGKMADLLRALEEFGKVEGFPEDASKAKTQLAILRKAAAGDIARASRSTEAYLKAKGNSLLQKTLEEAEKALAQLRPKWEGTEFESSFAELEVKLAEHKDKLVLAEREQEAEALRRRVHKFFDAGAWPMALLYGAQMLKDFPGTEAARKLRDSKLLDIAKRRQKEEEGAKKALDLLKMRLRNLENNKLYKEAIQQMLQSSEYRRYGQHKLFQRYLEELKAKAGFE